MVKLSKALPPKIKDKYISLMASFADVFAWDYSDLRTYDTNIFELSVLAFLFIPCIPLQHHIIHLKFVCFHFSIINHLYLFLQFRCVPENFLSCLLQVDHLIQPSLHGIFLTAYLMKNFDHRGSKRSGKYHVYSINQLKQ